MLEEQLPLTQRLTHLVCHTSVAKLHSKDIFTCGAARKSMDDKMSVGEGGGVNLSPWKI